MPLQTGDLEAAFQATGAWNVIAYGAVPDPTALDPRSADTEAFGPRVGIPGMARPLFLPRCVAAFGVVYTIDRFDKSASRRPRGRG